MKKKSSNSRRTFLKKFSVSTAAAAAVPSIMVESKTPSDKTIEYLHLVRKHEIAANDRIRVGLIGTGGMDVGDTQTALMVEGVEVVAACDLYQGRLTRAKELWGKNLYTTRDYRALPDRPDVDVVINATIQRINGMVDSR